MNLAHPCEPYDRIRPVLVRGGFCYIPADSLSIHHSGDDCNAFGPANPALDRAFRRRRPRRSFCSLPAAGVRFRTDAASPAARPPPATPAAAGRAAAAGDAAAHGIDEAVRLALENNLGIQIEKLNPQIQTLRRVARRARAYAPALVSASTAREQHVAADRLPTSARRPRSRRTRTSAPTAASSSTCRGAAATTRSAFDGSRATSNAIEHVVQPAARFGPQRQLSRSRCCATSRSTRLASSCSRARNQLQIADLQLQQRITQTGAQRPQRVLRPGRRDRRPRGRAGVARAVAQQSLKNNQRRVEVGTMAPIDIVAGEGGSREQRRERSSSGRRRSRARRTACAR